MSKTRQYVHYMALVIMYKVKVIDRHKSLLPVNCIDYPESMVSSVFYVMKIMQGGGGGGGVRNFS